MEDYKTYAVIDIGTNLVLNVIVGYPDSTTETCPTTPGTFLVEILPGTEGGIGWSWDGTNFVRPTE